MASSSASPLLKTQPGRPGYYEILIFAFLLIEFLFLAFGKVVDAIAMASYLVTYEFGFISKALIGSVFSLFTSRITSGQIYVTAVVSFLILIASISLLLGKLIRNSRQDMRSSVIVFVLLFLSSPLSVTYLLGMYIGRFDTYWIIITLLALIFIKNPVWRWAVPIMCAVAISVHQGYIFSYMPALMVPVLYEVYANKYSKRSFFIFFFSCFSLISLFIVFQVLPAKIPFNNAVDFSEYLSKSADFPVSPLMLHLVYFAPFSEGYYGYVQPLIASYALPFGFALLVFSLPFLIIFGVIWKKCFSDTGNKFLRFVFLLCAFSPLIFIPISFFLSDWERYWAAVLNTQFVLIFYFIYSNEQVVIDSVKKIGNFFEKHFLLLVLIIVFLCSIKFSEAATNISSFVQNKDEIIKILEDYSNSVLSRS